MIAHCIAYRNSGHSGAIRAGARSAVALAVLAAALMATEVPAGAKASLHVAKPTAAPAAAAAAGGDRVAQALAKGDIATAQELAEAAVARSPRDAGVRLVLGRVYLRAGRFESAAANKSNLCPRPEGLRPSPYANPKP